jgi:hypothetical protein
MKNILRIQGNQVENIRNFLGKIKNYFCERLVDQKLLNFTAVC